MTINEQTVLITGSSSGLGNITAKTLLREGATVVATMRDLQTRNADAANDLKAYAEAQPGTLKLVEMNVTDEASVDAAVAQAGRIDVVINNAGVGGSGFTEAFSVEQLRFTFDVNVLGVQRVMRAVLPAMRGRNSGLIINISSAMGRIVIPFSGAYTASKYALEGLSESYRYELVGSGVDVVIVEPGGFWTNYWSRMMQPADADRTTTYGDKADMPSALWSGIPTMLSEAEAANPQGLADVIVALIDTPAGERPLRRVVDPVTGGEGPKTINTTSEAVQRQVLTAFGLEHLLAALPSEEKSA